MINEERKQMFMSGYGKNQYDRFDYKAAEADLEDQGGDPWEISRTSERHRDAYLKEYGLDPKRYQKPVDHRYSSSSSDDGCYIATCVYGSYDCPPVWTLRRFRDGTLRSNAVGRAFIRIYYAVSPRLVRRFGKVGWFRMFWRVVLDRMVAGLRKKGVSSAPYRDRSQIERQQMNDGPLS